MTATASTRPLSDAQHSEAHTMIRALSITPWGRALVEGLERIRYFHGEGEAYDLGHGGRLVFGVNHWGEYGPRVGAVLLPSANDHLFYETRDYLEEEVEGALFWDLKHDSVPVLIPRVLGEWAAELVLTKSSVPVLECREARPVACMIKGQEGAFVTAPMSEIKSLPGLVRDKWAHKKAAEILVNKEEEDEWWWHCYHNALPGYGVNAEILPSVRAGEARAILLAILENETWWQDESAELLRATLQWATGFTQFHKVASLSHEGIVRQLESGDYWGREGILTELDLSERRRVLMEEKAEASRSTE